MMATEKPSTLGPKQLPQKGETVPRLRFPEFEDAGEWELKELSSVAHFINDKVSVSATAKDDYVSTENILPDFAGVSPPSSFPSSGSLTSFCINDVLIANIRPYLKKIYRAARNGAASNDVIVVRSKFGTNAGYLAALLQNDLFINYVMRGAKGVKMPRGDIRLMKQYLVGMPEQPEQQKIADCLGSLDEVIAATGRKLEALRQHKKGLLQQLFPQEGETVPRLRFPEFSSAPEWKPQRLDEASSSIFDGTHQTPSYTEAGVPFYSVENLISGKANKFISRDDYLEATRKNKPEKGDILLTRIGKIGHSQAVTWNHEFSVYVTLAVIKASPSFDSNYLAFCLQSSCYQAELIRKSLQSAVPPKINMDSLRSTLILLPDMEEQVKIAGCLGSLDDVIAAAGRKLDALREHKKGLLQQLFPSLDGL